MTDGWKEPSRFGWLWAIVAVIAVGLVAYWAGATLHDDPGPQADQVDVTEPVAEGEVPEDVEQRPLGQQQGEVEDLSGPREGLRAYGQDIQPTALRQYVDWVQSQPAGSDVTEENMDAYVTRGSEMLHRSLDDVLQQAEELTVGLEDEQTEVGDDEEVARGGGPGGLDVSALEPYRQQAGDSLEQVGEAGGPIERSEAFQRAATDAAALISEIEGQSNIASLRSPVEDLQQIARGLRPDEPLEAQSEDVQLFFDQAAYVLARMSQSFQATMPDERPR